MALKTFVKISEVNNLSDARYCAGMGVDQLGFNVVPGHSHFVDSKKFHEITGWVAGVKSVGEFGNQTADYAAEVLNDYGFDYIQTDRIDLLEEFGRLRAPVILNLNVDGYTDSKAVEKVFEYAHGLVEYFLVHSQHEGVNLQQLRGIASLTKRFNIVLGSWISNQNIADVLAMGDFTGIALKGGEEIKPGYKDFDELADILEVIEIEGEQ